MDKADVIQDFHSLTTWKRGDKRAIHKPLLLLITLSEYINSKKEYVLYEEIYPRLKRLLIEFGPGTKSYKTHYPFWRLEKDNIWQIDAPAHIRPTSSSGDISHKNLVEHEVRGGFNHNILQLLNRESELAYELVQFLMDEYFPTTIHADLRNELGLIEDPGSQSLSKKRKRDPAFRYEVLKAYENTCAVCGFNVMLDRTPIAIEAAHIKWHQYHGPDQVKNGLALCSVHHKLLDRGAFTITQGGILKVSELATGNQGFNEWLGKYHNEPIRRPVRVAYDPQGEYLTWHTSQVFKGSPRD